jgi:hypothetical protein
MSQQIAVRNRRISRRALLLAAAAAIAVTATVTCSGSAAASASGTPNVIQALANPPASGGRGYWAQTSCSEGDEIAYTEGWRTESAGGYPNPTVNGDIDTCLELGGAIEMRDEGYNDSTPESGPMFIYETPPVSYIAGGVLKVRLKAPHGKVYITTPEDKLSFADELLNCNTLCANTEERTISIDRTGGWQLFAAATCLPESGDSTCPKARDAELAITSATILLKNESTPTASGFAGSLASTTPVSGTATLTFNAQDKQGPGVYRVVAQIDGHEMASETPNANEGKCVANGTYYKVLNFRWRQPCPQETAASIEIPTAAISDGQHLLKVEVEDAAGNTAAVYEHTITVGDEPVAPVLPISTPALVSPAPVRGPANGTPASENAVLTAHWQGASTASLKSAYGRSHVVIGKLTNTSGIPIVGALIEVSQKPSSLGASASSLASTHTGTDGSFTIHVPSDASSSIQLAYRSHLGDAQPAATHTLTLQVPASLHLTVSPHVTSVGRTIVLSGKLAGAIPPGGKKVLFEARVAGGSWIEFHNATVDSHGRFRATHRFTFSGPISYQFRVVCEREADFPFLAGNSNVVRVWER